MAVSFRMPRMSQVDLGGAQRNAIAAAQGLQSLRAGEMEIAAAEQQQQRQSDYNRIRAASGGDLGAYAAGLEGEGYFDEANIVRERMIQQEQAGINFVSNLSRFVTPENYQRVRERAINAGFSEDMIPTEYDQNWIDSVQDRQRKSGKPFAAEDQDGNPVFVRWDQDTEQMVLAEGAAVRPRSKTGITIGKDGTVTIGGSPPRATQDLTKAARTASQRKVVALQDQGRQVMDVIRQAKPEYFEYKTQGMNWLAAKAEKMGMQPSEARKEMIREQKNLFNAINRFFMAYRKEITGAAAAVQELEEIKRSTLNENLSYTEFQAVAMGLIDTIDAQLNLHNSLLNEGIIEGSEQYRQRMEEQDWQSFYELAAETNYGEAFAGADEETRGNLARSEALRTYTDEEWEAAAQRRGQTVEEAKEAWLRARGIQ